MLNFGNTSIKSRKRQEGLSLKMFIATLFNSEKL